MSCPVCGAPSENVLCSAHWRAYRKLLAAYKVWHQALEISWRDYLGRVEGNTNSGRWVREICTFLLRNEGGEGRLKGEDIQEI